MRLSLLRTPLFSSLALSAALLLPTAGHGQAATPGTAVQEATIAADVKAMFTLAEQIYPSIFKNGSGWFSYSGYAYKFFPAAGIYAGVKDGNLFLLGGAYGNSLTPRGSVAAITALLQKTPVGGGSTGGTSGTTADFGNVSSVKNSYDLPRYFEELTMEWTTVAGALSIVSQLKMERLGVEQTGDVSTERLKLTITASNVSTATVAEMWVDSTGTTRRFILNGFEYAAAQAQVIGPTVVSGMLLAMAASDSATVKTAIANELKNPAVSTKVQKRTFAGQSLDTLVLTIGNTASLNYMVELTDFGSFSMATAFESRIGASMASSFKMLNIKLRQ